MPTFNEISAKQLRSLCTALGRQRSIPEYLLLQRFLFEGWGEHEVPARPCYRSLIGDDHSPYEYSVAFGGDGVELRILLEAQAVQPNGQGNHEAALNLTRRLCDVFSISLDRLEAVADLMCPREPCGPFSLWHAVCLHEHAAPSFKVYLNPQLRGRERATLVVREAFERLGLCSAAESLFSALPLRGGGLDEVSYFSLDLSDRPEARVKVYFCHHGVTAREVERLFAISPTHHEGDVIEFCHDMVGHCGPFIRKPVTSCFAFTSASEAPTGVTFHLPISHYSLDDALVSERVQAFLRKHGQDAGPYAELIKRFPGAPAAIGGGIQSYASYRRERSGMRLTVYLSPGLYQSAGATEAFEPTSVSGVFSTARTALAANSA